MLSEPPDADPHVRWCGGRQGEPGAYPITRGRGRAIGSGVPDPELVEQAKRRKFTAKYKAEILAKADACTRQAERAICVAVGSDL